MDNVVLRASGILAELNNLIGRSEQVATLMQKACRAHRNGNDARAMELMREAERVADCVDSSNALYIAELAREVVEHTVCLEGEDWVPAVSALKHAVREYFGCLEDK